MTTKKLTFGIFAHPDDAAFGPSGYLYLAAQTGDVRLVCVTCGGAGINEDRVEALDKVRENEERTSAKLIGAQSVTFLNYEDGTLCNNDYLKLADDVIDHLKPILDQQPATPLHIELLTFDSNGLSGHIDHIAVSMAATYSFLKLRDLYPTHTWALKYFCLPASVFPVANTDWLYMPKGRAENEIDEVVDVTHLKAHKLKIMRAHKTQRHDANQNIIQLGDELFRERFYYYKG